jgi:hydroxymethylglutaryl-CoA reductase
MLTLNREQSLYVLGLNKTNDKDQANTLNNLAMTQMRVALKQASAFFSFNKYDQCIDNIITAWQLPVSLKGTLLDSLPKILTDSSYTMLLFLSLFVRKGRPA